MCATVKDKTHCNKRMFFKRETTGEILFKYCLYLTCKVPDVLRKEPVRSREVLELARTMSKRDW